MNSNIQIYSPDKFGFYQVGEYKTYSKIEAIEYSLKATQVNSKVPGYWVSLAVAYALKGESNQAASAVAEVKKLNPNADGKSLNYLFKPLSASPPSYKAWYEKTYMPAYRKAGLTE